MAALPQEEDQIRTIAGYLLKNNAHLVLKASPDVAEYAKVAVLSAFSDPSALVRTAAGQDIVAFLGVLEPKNWPDCLEQLVGMLDDPNRQEVSAHLLERCATYVRAVTLRPYHSVIPRAKFTRRCVVCSGQYTTLFVRLTGYTFC